MGDRSNELEQYCTNHTSDPSSILKEIERETYLKTLSPQMLSGPLQGQLLRMISNLLNPQAILEIGTFTGYASICLADGLKENGILTTIEINPELKHITQKYFSLPQFKDKINLIIGDAIKIIPTLNTKFDLVFIDATKLQYDTYFDLIIPKLNKGGVILADNVLWGGKVLNDKKDKETQSLVRFNKRILADSNLENIMLPIRDGINIIRKL